MHDDGYSSSTPARKTDPLRWAPPPRKWALWHGPQAEAMIELARDKGRPAPPPADLPPAPEDFPAPMEVTGTWLLALDGRSFFVRGEVQNQYVSCFVCGLTG